MTLSTRLIVEAWW